MNINGKEYVEQDRCSKIIENLKDRNATLKEQCEYLISILSCVLPEDPSVNLIRNWTQSARAGAGKREKAKSMFVNF